MRKISVLFIAAVLALTLCACGNDDANTTATDGMDTNSGVVSDGNGIIGDEATDTDDLTDIDSANGNTTSSNAEAATDTASQNASDEGATDIYM